METQTAYGKDLLKTLGACILAPIATILCAGLAGGVWYFMNSLFTVIRPEILNFIAAIIGAVVGMFAARTACDSWLSGYKPHVVFAVYAILIAILAYMYLFLIPFDWSKLASYAQVGTIGYLAYRLFWVVDPI